MTGKEKSKYRQTKEWKQFRKKLIENKNHKCEMCDTKKRKGLHIHHLNEDKYGEETENDVVVLCSTCHKIVEWLLSRTKNPVDLNVFCTNLKWVYNNTKEEGKNGYSKD